MTITLAELEAKIKAANEALEEYKKQQQTTTDADRLAQFFKEQGYRLVGSYDEDSIVIRPKTESFFTSTDEIKRAEKYGYEIAIIARDTYQDGVVGLRIHFHKKKGSA